MPGNCKAQVPTAVPGMASHWSRCLSRHVCALMPWLLLLQRRWRGACRGGGPAPPPGCQWGSWHSCSACGIASLCPTILTSRSTRFFLGHHKASHKAPMRSCLKFASSAHRHGQCQQAPILSMQ